MSGTRWRWAARASAGTVATLTAFVIAGCGTASEDGAASGDQPGTAAPRCIEVGENDLDATGRFLLDEQVASSEGGPHQLAIALPEGWCVISHLAGSQAFDGAPIAGVRFAGPPDQTSQAYPMAEITGMWNENLGLDAAGVADGMEDTVDGDWTAWSGTLVGETDALIRSNQSANARDELQMITTAGEWAISVRAYGMEPAGLTGLAERIHAEAPTA